MTFRSLLSIALLIASFFLKAQDPERFRGDIENFSREDSLIDKKRLILFTGSSSITFWKDIKERFPRHNVLNRGFGGSQMSDLIYYANPVIFKYKPKKIIIYEGDNDIFTGKSPEHVLADADSLLKMIRAKLPKRIKVYFISAKPSVARWSLKDKYLAYNKMLKTWTEGKKKVKYIDVWNPMLAPDGEVMKDIFTDDNLHMNQKGYDIWTKVISEHL
jgi:lysophospholipase L1-like esterase